MYSDLVVITGPAEEPVSVDLARRHCRIDSDYDDDLLATYITVARQIAEAYCNRAFVTQTLQWTMAHSAPSPGGWPFVPSGPIFVLPLWFNWADVGGRWLELPRAPAQSVVSVATGMWGQDTDTVLVADTDYTVDLVMQPGRIRLTSQATNAQDHVSVQFTAGYGSAFAVPRQICLAILWTVAFLYENRGDVDAELPKAAQMLLGPYRLVTFG